MGKGVNAMLGDFAIRNRDGEPVTHRIRQSRKRSALPLFFWKLRNDDVVNNFGEIHKTPTIETL